MTDQTIQTQNEQPESVPVEAVVLKLLELAQQWNDTADKVDRDWYNDSAAYRECADELSDFVKELTAGAESKKRPEWEYGNAESNGNAVPTCSKCGWAIRSNHKEHEEACW